MLIFRKILRTDVLNRWFLRGYRNIGLWILVAQFFYSKFIERQSYPDLSLVMRQYGEIWFFPSFLLFNSFFLLHEMQFHHTLYVFHYMICILYTFFIVECTFFIVHYSYFTFFIADFLNRLMRFFSLRQVHISS